MNNKRRRKRRKGFAKWFTGLSTKKKVALIALMLILLLLLAVVFYVSWTFSKLDTEKIEEDEIIINEFVEEEVGVGYTNFVLFGGDSRQGDVDKNLNTDAIIIVSLNNETKEVKMVSVYRDTLLDLSNGTIQKCNAAYSRGGAKQAINMLNKNLDLNIQKYVTVDFGAVAEVIDMLGGLEINVSEAEMNATNDYIYETAMVSGKEPHYISQPGLQTLDGVQATTYARIRKGVGDDYARTERQRLVIKLAAEKAMRAGLGTLNQIIDKVFPRVSTNLTMAEVLKYAASLTKYKIGESSGFPFEKNAGTIPGKGSCVYPISLVANVQQLHQFLFGTENYQASNTVQGISYEIQNIVSTSYRDPVVEDPVVDNPVVDDPVVDDPVVDDPVVDDPIVDDPTVDDPVVDDPSGNTPVTPGDTTGSNTNVEDTSQTS